MKTEIEMLGRQIATKPQTKAELKKMPRSRRLAHVLWNKALDGDQRAIEYLYDRALGRPAQEIRLESQPPALIFQIIDPRLPLPAPEQGPEPGAYGTDTVEGEVRELPPEEATTEPGS